MKFSILTPAVPSRLEQLAKLTAELSRQIGDLPVEHLILMDNQKRTIGEKRDALLRAAQGDYLSFVDDDDWIDIHYVQHILGAIESEPDVVTFKQQASINGEIGEIEFGLGNPNEAFMPNKTVKRNAWHVCAWRRSLAILSTFPPVNYGEDWQFAERLCGLSGLKSVHIPQVLHWYVYSDSTTLAK